MKNKPITAVRAVLNLISLVDGRFSIRIPKTNFRLKVQLHQPYRPRRPKHYPLKRTRQPFRGKRK